MSSFIRTNAFNGVLRETAELLHDADPNEIERTKAAFEALTNDDFYNSLDLDKLCTVSAFVFNGFFDTQMPIESWLLGAITTAGQIGYLLGMEHMKGNC